MAMVAARDAVANLDCESDDFRESGVFMASTVAGLSEIDPELPRIRLPGTGAAAVSRGPLLIRRRMWPTRWASI